MRVLTAAGIAGVALVSLSACNKPAIGGSAAASNAPTADASAPAPPAPLTADTMPHRKPGLWSTKISMDGDATGPGNTLCVDSDSEARMNMLAQHIPGANCAPTQMSRNLDGSITFNSSCDLGANGKISSTGTLHGDFGSVITVDTSSQTSGSPIATMNGVHKMTMTSTWTGPCPPGQKGGDITMANGMKMNALDRERAAPPPSGE